MTQLSKKLNAVTKTSKHVVRKVTEDEAADLINKHCLSLGILGPNRIDDWFTHNGSQVVLSKRADGQHVVYTI